MTQTATLPQIHTPPRAQAEHAHAFGVDPGPWLLFVMPVSFAVTLLVVSWLSVTSF